MVNVSFLTSRAQHGYVDLWDPSADPSFVDTDVADETDEVHLQMLCLGKEWHQASLHAFFKACAGSDLGKAKDWKSDHAVLHPTDLYSAYLCRVLFMWAPDL